MELKATDDNPIPDGAVVGSIFAPGNVRLRYAHWKPTVREVLGTVCIFQGRGESIEKYFEAIIALRGRGFAVGALDWRGQGGSDRALRNGRKGHIDSFSEYDADLESFMRQIALPDLPPPFFALGHSTGAMICLRAARAGSAQFDRMVLSAPFIDFGKTKTPPAVGCRIAAFMSAIGLGELAAPGEAAKVMENTPFEDNPLTGDRERFDRSLAIVKAHPQVAVDGPTFGWLYAACTAVREAAQPAFVADIRVPTLIIAGGREEYVSLSAMERLAARLRGGGQVTIAGARHELLMEKDAYLAQFWAAFDAFVPGSA
ncbi:MAG: alpha/beta fold hydrolase [Alphaproteobacteria bacterium]